MSQNNLPSDWGYSAHDLAPGQLRRVNAIGFRAWKYNGNNRRQFTYQKVLQFNSLVLLLEEYSIGCFSDWWVISAEDGELFFLSPANIIYSTSPLITGGPECNANTL